MLPIPVGTEAEKVPSAWMAADTVTAPTVIATLPVGKSAPRLILPPRVAELVPTTMVAEVRALKAGVALVIVKVVEALALVYSALPAKVATTVYVPALVGAPARAFAPA